MKITIAENERGYFTKDKIFVRMLGPGSHRLRLLFGGEMETRVKVEDEVDRAGFDLNTLRRDPDFVAQTAGVVVPDEALALRYVDGRLFGVLTAGEYCFWNVGRENTFEIYDMKNPDGAAQLAPHLFKHIEARFYHKVEVPEGLLALLYFDGIYKRLLKPGVYYYWQQNVKVQAKLVNLSWKAADTDGQLILASNLVTAAGLELAALAADPDFAAETVHIEVPDDHLALISLDGRLTGALPAGDHYLWKAGRQVSHELVNIENPDGAGKLPERTLQHLSPEFYTQIEVGEGEAALLYFGGAFQRLLQAGTHYFWKGGPQISFHKMDLRWQQLELNGQEILTADKVSLRLNFICRYKIEDPVQAQAKHKNLAGELHALAQLAVRELVGRCRFDELLRQKESLADQILEKLAARQAEFYVTFAEAGLRDIILPGEVREIMNQVLVAEKAAQAAVITRREEVASTRSLLETSRLLEENATLYRLKEMEFIERICDKVGHISLDGGQNILEGLRRLVGTK
jgi:Membrane protease subunits, stomatin/prohibitin homologs